MSTSEPSPYPILAKTLPIDDLPFISPVEVATRNGKAGARLWIVIDEIVYDTTEFIYDHPGGEEAIQKFGGEQCGWQFWRMHNLSHMNSYASYMRVGRTKGIENKFEEPPKAKARRLASMKKD